MAKMVKLLGVIGRRADLTHEQFIKYQSTTHLKVVDRVPEFRDLVRGYMQNHLFVDLAELEPIKGLPISVDTDSVIEVWYDSVADVRRAFQEPRYFEIIRPDELSFGNVAGAWALTTNDQLVMECRGFNGRVKMFIFLKRRSDIDHPEFLSRWRARRNDQLMAAKAFRSYVGRFVENLVAQTATESLSGVIPFDLVGELWFGSLRDVAEFAADPDVIALSVGEGADYIDRSQTLIYVGEEKPATAEWLRRGRVGQ
jgi:hypothetical protein